MDERAPADDSVTQYETTIRGRVVGPTDEYDPTSLRSSDRTVAPSGRERESRATSGRDGDGEREAVRPSAHGALLGLALVGLALGGPGSAAGTVGFVLAEAIALYVGYEALTRAVDPALRRLVASD